MANSNTWTSHQLLLRASRELRLHISHAFSGVNPGFRGADRFPVNRMFYALDNCGEIRWAGSSRSLRLHPGTITFIPPTVDLEYDFTHGRMAAFHFTIEIFPGFDVFAAEEHCRQTTACREVSDVYSLMRKQSVFGDVFSLQGEVLARSSEFASLDPENLNRQVMLRERYAHVIVHISSNLDADLSVGSIAEELGLTRNQLSKRFNRDTGMPLKKFITELLTRRCAEELMKGYAVKDVAEQLSFSSEFYLSRFFKKHTGTTPSEFRTRYAAR